MRAFPGDATVDPAVDELMSNLAMGLATPEEQEQAFHMISETMLFISGAGLMDKFTVMSKLILHQMVQHVLESVRAQLKKGLN
jgi:hypothetical protein